MKTREEIENRRNELEKEMNEVGYTDKIQAEWKALNDEEKELDIKDYAIAIGRNPNAVIFVRNMYECGWAVETKVDGNWDYTEMSHVMDAMKYFAEFARKHGIATCFVDPYYLDINNLKKIDEDDDAYREEQEYADACIASNFGDDSLMERYNRNHGIEKEYSPSNPWDAPGMSIRDFI